MNNDEKDKIIRTQCMNRRFVTENIILSATCVGRTVVFITVLDKNHYASAKIEGSNLRELRDLLEFLIKIDDDLLKNPSPNDLYKGAV